MFKVSLLVLSVLCVSSLRSQNNLFQFILPSSMVFEKSDTNDNSITYYYSDINRTDWLQKTVFQKNGYEVSYGRNSTNDSFYWDYDSLNRIIVFTHKVDRTFIGYSFYQDGRLSAYFYGIEDSLISKPYFSDDSFRVEFHQSGTVKTRYYFLDVTQEYKEYWSNGKLKIVADFLADEFIFCGNYREYDEKGKLAVKGQYCIDENQLDPKKKCGVWKYYENGRRVKKERY